MKKMTINIKCLYFGGWSSSEIESFNVVRIDKKWKRAFNSEGKSEDLDTLYEYSDENLKIKKDYEKKKNEGWKILREAESIGKSMSKAKFEIKK